MFERPLFLFGLILLVPVLIAFLYRRQDRVATVPSTLIFARVANARFKNRKLRSLARRFAFIACIVGVGGLVLAAAEPRPRGRARSIAIVVDVSASMGTRDADPFGEARDTLRQILRQRTGHDRISIIAAGHRPRHLVGPTGDTSALHAAVDALRPERAEADLSAAMRLAEALVRRQNRGQIWLLTDGGAAASERLPELAAPLRVFSLGSERQNVGLTLMAARTPNDARDEEDREVLLSVAASGDDPRRVAVTLEAEGVELERQELTLRPPEEREVSLRLRVVTPALTARVEPLDDRDDALTEDDRITLELGPTTLTRVHLVSADDLALRDSGRYFIERALTAAGVQEIVTHSPEDAPNELSEGELAVVLDAAPEHAIDGPTLYVATASGALPLRISARLSADGGGTRLRSIDADHSLTRGVDLDGATIDQALAVELPDSAEGALELDGGTVVALGGEGRARWAYVGIDPGGSDLVLRVAFPVLMANALATLGGAAEVRVASSIPRDEVILRPSTALSATPELASPFPWPTSPPLFLSILGAAALLFEGLAFARGWSR